MTTRTDLGVEDDQLPPLIPRTMDRLTHARVGRAMLQFHRWIYARSDGRVGPGMIGASNVLLRTVGRRTGQSGLTALVFARDGERSLWPPRTMERITHRPGSTTCALAEVEVQVGRRRVSGRATVIDSTDPISTAMGTHERDQQQAV